MTPTFVAADGILQAPARNRFFYGKLMDVAHFQEEQDYFRRQQALINRLALGSGVLAGLNVVAGNGGAGTVLIQPGAAIDGAGRLIVVPNGFELDAHQATDATGTASGAPLTAGTVVISLAYAESATDPVAVLVPHCDAPADCAPSSTVEGFLMLVRVETTAPVLNYGCTLGKISPPPPDPALLKLLAGNVSAAFPALAADVSVPLGRVNLADGTIDAFADRTIVFSNPLLWQVVNCMAQQVGTMQGAILRYVSGDNQSAPVTKAVANPLVVELVDGGGNPVAGSIVQFKTSNGTVAPGSIATDAKGRAQAAWTLSATLGDQVLTAGAVGSPLTVSFHAQATKG